MAIITSKQDASQVLRLAYDDATQSIRTKGGGSNNGAPAPSTSTVVAGIDPAGNTHPLQTDAQGALEVTFAASATQTVVQPNGALLHTTVDASALPTGAATSANQTSANASLSSIDSKLTSPLAVTGPLTDLQLRATAVPVSGSVTVTQATGTNLHTVVDSSALPTGAATSANQSAAQASLSSIDSKLTAPLAVTGPLTDTQLRATAVPVSMTSAPLPTGSATAAKQDTGNTSLNSIDTKTPGLGQALAAGSTPVVLPAAQITALTPPTSVGLNAGSNLVGSVKVTDGTNTVAVSASGSVLVSGLSAVGSAPALNPITVSGVDGAGNKQYLKQVTGTNALVVDGSAVTQPVSMASLPLPTGAATSAGQTATNASLSSIDSKLTSPLIVSGAAAAGVAPTFNPVSISGTDAGNLKRHFRTDTVGRLEINTAQSLPLPTGAATSANQIATNVSLSSVDTKIPALGQALAAGSTPVVLTAAQIATLTPLTTVGLNTGTNTIGSVKLTDGTNTAIITASGGVLVSGSSAVGSAPVLNPLSVSGVDGAGNKQHLKQVTGTNALVVDGTADRSVSGSLTALNSAVSLSTQGSGTTIFELTGTLVGTFIFEASNNSFTTSQAVAGVFLGGIATQSSSFSANGVYSVLTAGFQQIRVRVSAYTSGTASVLANASSGNRIFVALQGNPNNLQTLATQGPAGASPWLIQSSVQGPVTPGTVATNSALIGGQYNLTLPTLTTGQQSAIQVDSSGRLVIAGIPLSLGQQAAATSQPVTLSNENVQDLNVTGQAAQTAIVNNILTTTSGVAATDLNGYRSGTIQLVSTGTAGTFIFEGSNDNVNFQTIPMYNQLLTTGVPIVAAITATVSQIIYTMPIVTRYVRLRIVTAITGGSIQTFSRASQVAYAPGARQVANSIAANLLTTTNIASGVVTTVSAVTAITNALPAGTNTIGAVTVAGKAATNLPVFNNYGTTPVTTAAYVQLVASTTAAITHLSVFDSGGQGMIISTGAAASEVIKLYVPPGGGEFDLAIPTATRIAIKALTGNATSGFLIVNMLT